ncbi:SGNH/GDSL hydrolase family protein [Cryobacterium psychrophilum]|uniref:SGNH/GDSL hydrolase family protein n=1 Tax=Cryobacterium psychrophilum TaxID=41988 RepID=A0A4Y8KN35_9MICO|nr:SGNH/GDSL hydrolase family protein [Cryobacterium psychrophilum]TDW30424.1 lysophospholipase L1-like esterase [Cryobacterium psychrophilum]TFD79504.1 SGNH/GDSL hydrolase family protein [Cryobacterium psychrophilum]
MGDSFTEGVGDELPSGELRGWADLVALGLAVASAAPVEYANLAIRGKLLRPIVDGQLDPALALGPDLLSICGGGNDVMRPRVEIPAVVDLLESVVDQALERGAHVLMLTGGNPTRHLPLGSLIQRRGDRLADAARERFTRPGVTYVDNWVDPELALLRYWSSDHLHLNARGHARVASNALTALGLPVPGEFVEGASGPTAATRVRTPAYYREHVLPWIGRRLTGRSSGDGRSAKRPALVPAQPPTSPPRPDAGR